LLNRLAQAGCDVQNVTGKYSPQEISELYGHIRILINIHQTEAHHTFEELRVLPALLCGAIVISEDSPLRETVPYSKFILWSDMEHIVPFVREVEKNYDKYFDALFSSSDFEQVVEQMHARNEEQVHKGLSSLNRPRSTQMWSVASGRIRRCFDRLLARI